MDGFEWQTVALYCAAGFLAAVLLWRWHMSQREDFTEFSLVGLIADRINGKWHVSSSKFQEFGAFVIASLGVVVCIIRSKVPVEFVGLLTLYAGVFVLRRLGGQQITSTADAAIRTEAIRSGLDPMDFKERRAEPRDGGRRKPSILGGGRSE